MHALVYIIYIILIKEIRKIFTYINIFLTKKSFLQPTAKVCRKYKVMLKNEAKVLIYVFLFFCFDNNTYICTRKPNVTNVINVINVINVTNVTRGFKHY